MSMEEDFQKEVPIENRGKILQNMYSCVSLVYYLVKKTTSFTYSTHTHKHVYIHIFMLTHVYVCESLFKCLSRAWHIVAAAIKSTVAVIYEGV